MNIISAIILGIALIGSAIIYMLPSYKPPPPFPDTYWGPGKEPKKMDTSIRPFKINFEQKMIDDLRHRLKNTREMQGPLEGVGWSYGATGPSILKIVDYWLNKYDFKKREEYLNKFPQYLTNIQGLDIHFIHVKPQLPKNSKIQVVPLYIQHGWGGSVYEFRKIIPLLTTPQSDRDFVFEVVIPSLPGFAYSDATSKPGLGVVEMGHVMKNLMLRLGFERFYVQGGDWGAMVVNSVSVVYPQHVLGQHSNMCMILLRPWTWFKLSLYNLWPSILPEDEAKMIFPIGKWLARVVEESGYYHIQSTKPDTVGVGLTDSPAGLAAYLLEKYSSVTKMSNRYAEDGNLLEKWTLDELIDNLMIYWAPNKMTTSMRVYAESMRKKSMNYNIDLLPVTVPSACAQFPDEIVLQPAIFLRDKYVNLLRVTKMPRGGHFAASEEPQLFADDVWSSVEEFRSYHARQEKE